MDGIFPLISNLCAILSLDLRITYPPNNIFLRRTAMKNKKLIFIGIGILNFVGLGIGSFLLQLWKRGLASLLVSLGLLAAVFVTQNLLLIIPLAIWLVLVAADGWNQARKQSF